MENWDVVDTPLAQHLHKAGSDIDVSKEYVWIDPRGNPVVDDSDYFENWRDAAVWKTQEYTKTKDFAERAPILCEYKSPTQPPYEHCNNPRMSLRGAEKCLNSNELYILGVFSTCNNMDSSKKQINDGSCKSGLKKLTSSFDRSSLTLT